MKRPDGHPPREVAGALRPVVDGIRGPAGLPAWLPGHIRAMAEPNRDEEREPNADDLLAEPPEPAHFEAFEERPEVADAIDNDTTVHGLTASAQAAEDPDNPLFQPPAR